MVRVEVEVKCRMEFGDRRPVKHHHYYYNPGTLRRHIRITLLREELSFQAHEWLELLAEIDGECDAELLLEDPEVQVR